MTPKNWLERYRSGEHEAVWAELVGLGASVREPDLLEQALEVARETMARARQNVEEIHRRLLDVGYEFQNPGAVYAPPAPEMRQRLDQQESKIGPLPLSLRAFYEVVGTVDFTQSIAQHLSFRHRSATAPELRYLGEYDPLVVVPLDDQPESRSEAGHHHFFAPDEFHKAHYSGGENYHVVLPDARADFPISGMYEIDEFFVPYLRATFTGGGFRGKIREVGDRAVKDLPNLVLTAKLADGLLPI